MLRNMHRWRRWRAVLGSLLVLATFCTYSHLFSTNHERLSREVPGVKSSGVSRAKRSLQSYASRDCTLEEDQTSKNTSSSQFPEDLFSLKARRKGAIVLHFAGLVYMFVALAIVCDEFFVPALDALTEKLEISDDVAGATFMAAGGSAPEFFTSVFGVFVSQDNVGIGTIVGSATFNILCVLAFCSLFSREVLHLTWWPLFRDISFYIFALFLLVLFFADEKIVWHEALTMLLVYVIYGIFMKYNQDLELSVKSRLFHLPTINENIHGGGQQLRNGIITIAMTGSIDHDGTNTCNILKKHGPVVTEASQARTNFIKVKSKVAAQSNVTPNVTAITPVETVNTNGLMVQAQRYEANGNFKHEEANESGRVNANGGESQHPKLPKGHSVSSNDESPLDMSWPATPFRQLIYVLLAPILFPLYLTLPDTRIPEKKRYFPITFFGSILWIAGFSYLMVWWATTIGETIGVPTEIMGLTILAAGTSIPDLITSVIVARKGLGDMAVSSSIGSNLFDICIGLPVPWLMFFIGQLIKSPFTTLPTVSVVSNGLICSVGMLFVMLIVLVIIIAASKWRMDKIFGLIMIIAYIIFCIFSILLETRHLDCPLKLFSEESGC